IPEVPAIAGIRPTGMLPFQLCRQAFSAPRRETPGVVPGHVHHGAVAFPFAPSFLCQWVFLTDRPAIRLMSWIKRLIHQIRHGPLMHQEGCHESPLPWLSIWRIRAVLTGPSANFSKTVRDFSIDLLLSSTAMLQVQELLSPLGELHFTGRGFLHPR